jgi:hypothetical protein
MMLFPHVMIRPLLRGNVATTGAIINLSGVKRKARLGEKCDFPWISAAGRHSVHQCLYLLFNEGYSASLRLLRLTNSMP